MSSFIEAQDEFHNTMCQAEAVIGSLYDNFRFEDLEPDHVGALLSLIKDNLKKLGCTYEGTIAAVNNELGA